MKENFPQSGAVDTDVLIVGYGPVGAAVAALLGKYGVKTLVVEQGDEILMMPRAIALDNEALRILQMAGLDDDSFDRIGIQEVKMHCPYVGEFSRINVSGSIDGHPKLVTFYQPDLEKALRQKAESYSSTAVELNCELLDLQQDAQGVDAIVRGKDGEERRIRARYVVGADGASSKVRGLIGQEFQGKSFSEDWLIVDASQRESKAIDHVEFICDPRRPIPHMPAPGGRERWEFMLQPNESREEMEAPEKVAELLQPWIEHKDLNIERQAVYRFHARCCDRFQNDRIFLVGDAAHITPPFVGQGLVAGLRDAANLSWKLSWALRHGADESILQSYDQERRPHAKQMINLAKLMGKLVMPRSRLSAIAIHGVMKIIRLIPGLGSYFEDLEVKPANSFRRGLFLGGKNHKRLVRGGQFPQDTVRSQGKICLSDEVLGDQLTLVGIGINPASVLDEMTTLAWSRAGGQLVHLGMRGEPAKGATRFAEIIGNDLALDVPGGWLVVVRPDRVIMHDGAPDHAVNLVRESLGMIFNWSRVNIEGSPIYS